MVNASERLQGVATIKNVVATGKIGLSNNTEMHVGPTPPLFPEIGQLWLNTSETPPVLYVWDGEAWMAQQIDIGELDPDLIDSIRSDLSKKTQELLNEINQIKEDADALKADVIARNQQDDAYFVEMQSDIENNRVEALGWYNDNNGRISTISQSLSGITSRVSDAENNISRVTQTANGLQSTVNSIANGTHSVITQMSDRINLRVEKNNIVSQLNLSNEGIYIAGKLLYLDGNVNVAGTFVAPKIVSTGRDSNGRQNYTKIEGQELTSYGYYANYWRDSYYYGEHYLIARNGYIRMRQDTGNFQGSLYYTAKGISTVFDGSNNSKASGCIEFFASGYSATGYSMILASVGNVILESTASSGSRIFLNPNGAGVHVCDANYNYYNLYASKLYADGSSVTSDENKKKNIEVYDGYVQPDGTFKSALEQVIETTVKTYNLKVEDDDTKKRLGIILQEAPYDVIDPEGGVDLYAMISMLWKAVQELNQKVGE